MAQCRVRTIKASAMQPQAGSSEAKTPQRRRKDVYVANPLLDQLMTSVFLVEVVWAIWVNAKVDTHVPRAACVLG